VAVLSAWYIPDIHVFIILVRISQKLYRNLTVGSSADRCKRHGISMSYS